MWSYRVTDDATFKTLPTNAYYLRHANLLQQIYLALEVTASKWYMVMSTVKLTESQVLGYLPKHEMIKLTFPIRSRDICIKLLILVWMK